MFEVEECCWSWMDFSEAFGSKNGASKVSAYVTQGVFPKRSWECFGHDN
jgi:hypothetical protein